MLYKLEIKEQFKKNDSVLFNKPNEKEYNCHECLRPECGYIRQMVNLGGGGVLCFPFGQVHIHKIRTRL